MNLSVGILLGFSIASTQDCAPVPIYKPEASYPKQAARICGTVTLTFDVNVSGNTSGIQVVQGLDPGLDAEAVRTVGTYRSVRSAGNGNPENEARRRMAATELASC